MCGRFAFYSPAEATAALFGVDGAPALEARYNIAPTTQIAAIRNGEDGSPEFALLKWGLVPFWAKDKSIGNRMINARAETVAEKPAYRSAYRHRRCLVLADGFYEWRKEGAGKTPYFISLASGEPFAFGGLWESWTDKETGEVIDSATLITTEANEYLSQIHHRMPLVLEPDGGARWLSGDMQMLDSIETPRLRAWPVDRRVNNARNEGSGLVDPAGEAVKQGGKQ